jgi:hypothetical protein
VRVTGPGQPIHILLDIVELLNEIPVPYASRYGDDALRKLESILASIV